MKSVFHDADDIGCYTFITLQDDDDEAFTHTPRPRMAYLIEFLDTQADSSWGHTNPVYKGT